MGAHFTYSSNYNLTSLLCAVSKTIIGALFLYLGLRLAVSGWKRWLSTLCVLMPQFNVVSWHQRPLTTIEKKYSRQRKEKLIAYIVRTTPSNGVKTELYNLT